MRNFFYDTEFIEYPNTIDLISIGVVSEKGDEFYRISTEFDAHSANIWVKDNVLSKLPCRNCNPESYCSRHLIATELLTFLKPSKEDPVQLYGYYSAYDHVVLCWLFGPMIKLPEGMPMYTMDLKQIAVLLGNPELPKQSNEEHNALNDAEWNREVYLFLREYEKKYKYDLEI